MFKDIDELKQFLLWAKKEKIAHIKLKDIEIVFTGLAFVDPVTLEPSQVNPTAINFEKKMQEEKIQKEEEELLNWSSS